MSHAAPPSGSPEASGLPRPPYRADIDGLRGLAVLAVVLFHGAVPGFSGGYVGVDVFFVISGYLITQLLVAAEREPLGTRLRRFYLRRARRILPALIVTALATAVVGAVMLLPWDLARLGEYLAATAVFATNFVAWVDRFGYFQSTAAHDALTHLWSIAIEEQFYLLYPLALFAIGANRRRGPILLAIGMASFALCVWGSYYRANANYFLAPSRAWELMLGAVLALAPGVALRSRALAQAMGALALLTLAAVVVGYSERTPFPGWYALAPCAAAGALIVSGRDHPTGARRLLEQRALVFTGLVSYSLYLWHFPVLVLAQYYHVTPLGAGEVALLLTATYLLAVASWRLVEQPIRSRAVLCAPAAFVPVALACTALVLAAGGILWASGGLPGRFPGEFRERDPALVRDELTPCVTLSEQRIAAGALCSYGTHDPDALRAVLWGDSHAMMLLPAYIPLAQRHHVRLYLAATSSCRPLLGITMAALTAAALERCAHFNRAVVRAVLQINPQLLILNGHWIGVAHFEQGLLESLRQTRSSARTVCVVKDVPTYPYDLPYALGEVRRRGLPEGFLHMSREQGRAQYRDPDSDLGRLQAQGLLRTVDPDALLCAQDECLVEADGRLLYRDGDHLSSAGAQFVAPALEGCFRDLPGSASLTHAAPSPRPE